MKPAKHTKLSVTLKESTILQLMGKGKTRSKLVSEAVEKLLKELDQMEYYANKTEHISTKRTIRSLN